MTTYFRWFTWRLLFSLLFLPVVAFFVLWLLHEVVFPGRTFGDLPMVVALWLMLLWAADQVLRRWGTSRYSFLQQHAELALAGSATDDLERIYELTLELFASGLISPHLVSSLQRDSRRHFLAFHERRLDSPEALEHLRQALREGFRRDEIHALLKNHLLSQPRLTTRLLDLAEDLLDQKPADAQLLDHLLRKFVESRTSHHRAEHFYQRHLEGNGRHTPAIVSLYLENLTAKNRRDDFALWIYVRAFEGGQRAHPALRRLLFEASRLHQATGRDDVLASAVDRIAADFSPDEFAAPAAPQKPRRTIVDRKVLHGWKEELLRAGEKVAALYARLHPLVREFHTRHRRYVLAGGGALVVLFSLWLIYVNRPAPPPPAPAIEQEEDLAGYFALQVGAWKKSRSAEQERERLQTAGLRVRVLEPSSSAGWYRIHVGRYRTRTSAQAAADSLKRRGVIEDYFIAEYQSK